MRTWSAVAYALVLVLAVELALWEAFLVAARPFDRPLPVAAALAVVGNLAVGLAGASVLRRPLGAAVPGLLWLVIALALGSTTSAGDLVVPNSGRGVGFLLAGAGAAAAAVALAGARWPAPRKPRASP